MKAKSFHCSKSGSAQVIAAAIGTNLQCVSDKMPPAYPCDNDKIVFIGAEMTGKAPAPVADFCKNLNPQRTKAVAFYIINGSGDTSGLESIIKDMEAKGVKTVGEILSITVKSSMFKKGMPTDADVQTALDWAKKCADLA